MHYYDIYPQIVPADRVSEIRIHPRFSHAAIPTGDSWCLEMRHAPFGGVTEKRILPAYVWADRDGVPLEWHLEESGDLVVRAYFAGEQEHNLELFITRDDNPDYFKNQSFKIYSLRPDWYGLRPFKIDSHMHTTGSDGREDCRYVVSRCREKGFDAVAVTDHRRYEPSLEAAAAWKELVPDFNIIPGEEVHAPDNPVHIVNFGGRSSVNDLYRADEPGYRREVMKIASTLGSGVPEEIRFAVASCRWVFDRIRETGGLAVFCHPYWTMSRIVLPEPLIDAVFADRKFDAAELIGGFYLEQSEANNFQAVRCLEERERGPRFPVLAVSDSHGTERFPVNRPNIANFCGVSATESADAELFNWYYSVVLAEGSSTDELIAGIKRDLSAAVEYPQGARPHIFGDFRLVKYVSFLLREYFPVHDPLCRDQGLAMLDHLAGDSSAAARLALLQGRVSRRREAFFGGTPSGRRDG